jgi:nitroreductase
VGPLKDEFGIPDTFDPVGAITLGHPAPGGAAGSPTRRPRKAADEVVHRGHW